jgi:uncharacterized membrane protein required for colicin V production
MTLAADSLSMTLWVALGLLALLMVRGAWRGYRRGPLRQLAGPAAIAVGQTVGWIFGSDLGHACLQGTSFPWILRGAAGIIILSGVAGLLCYALFWRLGRLPKGQTEAESPVLGALVGCWTGLLYFLILVGTLAMVAAVYDLFETPDAKHHHWTVRLRNDLAGTSLTQDLKSWSPIPERQKVLIKQTRRLMLDPEARKRLMAQAEIRALAAHPTLYQAWGDKEVRKLLENNDLSGFLDHPKVRAVLADEELQKQAESIDLPAIIERSFKKPLK